MRSARFRASNRTATLRRAPFMEFRSHFNHNRPILHATRYDAHVVTRRGGVIAEHRTASGVTHFKLAGAAFHRLPSSPVPCAQLACPTHVRTLFRTRTRRRASLALALGAHASSMLRIFAAVRAAAQEAAGVRTSPLVIRIAMAPLPRAITAATEAQPAGSAVPAPMRLRCARPAALRDALQHGGIPAMLHEATSTCGRDDFCALAAPLHVRRHDAPHLTTR